MSYKTYESAKLIKITTPSAYGSHLSMVVEDLGEWVVCKDDIGTYRTKRERLDTGFADPYRNTGDRL